jgi:hypothetical protein
MTKATTDTREFEAVAAKAIDRLAARWGKGWSLLDSTLRRGLVAMAVLDVLTMDVPRDVALTPKQIRAIQTTAAAAEFRSL